MKVAIVYDRINKWGGAERLLQSILSLYPSAPLYTLTYHPQKAAWAQKYQVYPSIINRLSFLRARHELLSLVSPLGFESFNFDSYDLVISVTSENAKAIITKPHTLHICYCLTPTRYLWSGFDQYHQSPGLGIFSRPARFILNKGRHLLQSRDLVYANRPDCYLTISHEVQKRISKYYQKPSDVIYPGIDYKYWSKDLKLKRTDSYLYISRLVPYKKADLVIKTFNQLQKRLTVVGTGSDLSYLKRIAKSNIHFLGHVDDAKLRHIYQASRALVFPQLEDFGLVPLEAQAAGLPVLAYNQGGAKETIVQAQTGLFFQHQTVDSLSQVILDFEANKHQITANQCRENARKFDESFFIKHFSDKVNSLYETHSDRWGTR